MKHLKLKIFFFPVLMLIGFTSCLKKGNINTDPDNSPAVIAFGNTTDNVATSASTYPEFHIDLGTLKSGASANFNINVVYDGAGNAPSDITVNLALDQAALTLYNTQNGTNYVIPPSAVFSFPTSAVIKSGTRSAQVQATINNNASYDFSKAYAIPLKISSVSSGAVSANFGEAIFSFGLRNPYDGIYSVVSGTVTRYTAPGSPANDALSGSVAGNSDMTLSTVGANTVQVGNLQWARNQGGVGGVAPVYVTVDPVTNLVTMSAGGNATLTNWVGHPNYYDPATKTFYLAFIWNPTSTTRTYEVVLKYKGPR